MAKYVACICEGGAEHAILDLLLNNHKLIFSREDLIEEEVLKCRRGQDFEGKYREFKNRKEKPSTYCKNVLKYNNVKSYDFIYKYFCDIDVLINALHEYDE